MAKQVPFWSFMGYDGPHSKEVRMAINVKLPEALVETAKLDLGTVGNRRVVPEARRRLPER